ncbi:MAG: helix-turn-helix transcriptional regulator [Bdellovibrio sp.]
MLGFLIFICISSIIAFSVLKKYLNKRNPSYQFKIEVLRQEISDDSHPNSEIEIRREFEIEYINEKQEKSQRKVVVFQMYFNKGVWLLRTHCHMRNDFRTFRVDRIQLLVDLETGEEIPKNFAAYFESIGTKIKAS